MGVPKFFRYMSERYPCLSEVVREYQIPIFDNLYLDMNGIIHMCSHPDDNNPHFRITEEKLFSDIFHYIEVLFRMIRPQKVFFMAIDGVAPRAKMNQQRGRRFRSAKDANRQEAEAVRKGEQLPTEARFDSNCITPGTEFMAKLQEQLKYFVVKKISTDNLWKKCKVILSGHETPGEGEHKIMDYIRYIRSQPGYDPNTRHCLYGLDADLIMLGLCTHDPHFSLLREEVKFGKKSTKRNNTPEEIRFYLLHLSLMREYLELEFHPLKRKLEEANKFEFDIEKIIDDWVLMGFLVGNDFIPHLPNLHITNGALPKLYKAYVDVLPTLDGYINESGTLNLERFEKFMTALASMDLEHFEETRINLEYMEMKTGRKQTAHTPVSTKPQKSNDGNGEHSNDAAIFDEGDRIIDPDLAELIRGTDDMIKPQESNDGNGEKSNDNPTIPDEDDHMIDPDLVELIRGTDDMFLDSDDDDTSDDEVAFKQFKDEYYRNKMEYEKVTPEVMRSQAEGYVRAIQWNLNYYYNGVCSWSWYYPHHYAPYISDIKDFANFKIDFDLGVPFKPYEQLLAVLPSASKQLLPECYHHLMTDENSIIKQYYPEDFQTDLNGKKQEWEAVVLVPFIDEKILLEAMKACNDKLTEDEIKRNQHGPMLIYQYADEDLGCYKAPNYFQTIANNHAKCTPVYIEDIRVDKDKLIKGAYPGAKFDVFYPGFPTMKHLTYEGKLKMARVKIFEQPSRNESMILKVLFEKKTDIPLELLGKNIFVGWPHLLEAKVIALSNETTRYVFNEKSPNKYDIGEKSSNLFASEVEGIQQIHMTSMGIDFGDIQILVHVNVMIGRRYIITANGRLNLEKQFASITSTYPLQGIVCDIKVHDEHHTTFRDITDVFPVGSACFTLSNLHYGSQGKILDSTESLKNERLTVSLTVTDEPDLSVVQEKEYKLNCNYFNLYQAAQQVAISNYLFSRVTGSLFIKTRNPDGTLKSVNIGLDMKFNKRNQEIPGYSRKSGNTWQYSNKAINIVKEYVEKFPQIFEYLSNNKDVDELNADEIFNVEESDDIIKSIQTWLKSLPLQNIKPKVCNSSVLDNELVGEIEKIVDEFKTKQTTKQIVMQLKPQLLFKPELQVGNIPPDPFVQTRIFDRIVNVRAGFTVPFGLKGTVIAVSKTANSTDSDEIYDIVFDEPFDGGMTISCTENRGYRLHKNAFINLSHGHRQMEQKTGKPGALRAQVKNNQIMNSFRSNSNQKIHNNNNNNSNNNTTTNVRGPVENPSYYMQHLRQQPQQFTILPRQPLAQQSGNNQSRMTATTSGYSRNDFMPNYGSKARSETANQPNGKKIVNQKLDQKAGQSKPKTDINTDYLKKLLKIDNSPNAKARDETNNSSTSSSSSSNKNQTIFNSSMCATAKLMNYFQANCLGCPRYTYLNNPNGFIAQVISPTQQIVTGKPSKTREEASENAASVLLKILQENQNKNLPLPKFPEPPVKWVMQNTQQPSQQQERNRMYRPTTRNYTNNNNNNHHHHQRKDVKQSNENSFSQKRINTTPKNSFVPLQAMIKQGNRHNGSFSGRNLHTNNQVRRDERKQETQTRETAVNKESSSTNNNNNTKTGRTQPRKTRIAANFVGNRS